VINPKELLLVVDEKDQPLQILPRKDVHEKMLLHRISHIWVIDDQQRVLAQKRSIQKDRWAGMWECWFGGHVLADEDYLTNAIAETGEELGVKVTATELHLFGKKVAKTKEENIIVSVYGLQKPLDITTLHLEAEEVDHVEWFTISNLKRIYQEKQPGWVAYGYELDVLGWLERHFTAYG
jgi:isopentenyldiphosphate isomerase